MKKRKVIELKWGEGVLLFVECPKFMREHDGMKPGINVCCNCKFHRGFDERALTVVCSYR